jgi:hypothetical protein
MKKSLLLISLLFLSALKAEESFRIENTNFTISQGSFVPNEEERYTYNYNRLRLYYDWHQKGFFMHMSGDGVYYFGKKFTNSDSFSYLAQLSSNTPIKTQSNFHHYDYSAMRTKLYRFYGGYQDDKNRLVAGLQNISMGVGHIWTPSNLFNSKNSYALEPDETFGVMALSYTRYIGVDSQFYGVASSTKEKNTKYAAGFKTTMGTADIGLNSIYSNKVKMLGYTVQSDLADTGIQIRSEGALIKADIDTFSHKYKEKSFFQALIGADYAFAQGLNLTVEALYSSKTFSYNEVFGNINSVLSNNLFMSHFYLGTSMDYDFTIYLSGSLLYVESFNEQNSHFISPSLSYTVNNNNVITLGAQLYGGSKNSEFGKWQNSYYVKYVFSW